MIIYKDILGKLKDAGYSSHKIREMQLMGEGTVQAIREERSITLKTVDTICQLLRCKIEDIIEITLDDEIPFSDP